jgi:hypothetical protein
MQPNRDSTSPFAESNGGGRAESCRHPVALALGSNANVLERERDSG